MPLSALVVPLMVAATPNVTALPGAQAGYSASTPIDNEAAGTAPTANADNKGEPARDPASSTAATSPDNPFQVQNEIIVTRRTPSPVDPVEKLNAMSFQAVQAVDKAVIEPVTHAYESGVPEPARDGLHNALDNLDEPVVFLNFLLQLKPGKAFETLGRFAINSTLGVGGLFDIAKRKPFNLPRRSNGFADTLGFYGVGSGPYFYLPIIGPTTLRDLLARPFDLLVLPAIFPKPFADPKVALGKGVLSALDERMQDDEKLKRLHSTQDPYVTQREEYLARRRAEIEVLKGKRKSIDDPPYYQLPPIQPKEGQQETPIVPLPNAGPQSRPLEGVQH